MENKQLVVSSPLHLINQVASTFLMMPTMIFPA